MTRTLKLILCAAIAWMALVALAVYAWRQGVLPLAGLSAPGPDIHPQPLVYFLPLWIAVAAILCAWRMAPGRTPRISESHRRFFEGSLRAVAVISVVLQGLFAYLAVSGETMNMELVRRCVVVFMGLWLMSYGNALAKIDPPSGEGAPAPSIWTRASLRAGWLIVIVGLAMAVCAFLPKPLMAPVYLVLLAVMTAGGIAFWRVTRPARTARTA